MDSDDSTMVNLYEVLEAIDRVEEQIEDEDFTYASREQVFEGTVSRIRDEVESLE